MKKVQKKEKEGERKRDLMEEFSRKGEEQYSLVDQPDAAEYNMIRGAMHASPDELLPVGQLKVNNALLKAEVALLERKVAYKQAVSKRTAWIDAVLLKLDARQIRAIKHAFQQKAGVAV